MNFLLTKALVIAKREGYAGDDSVDSVTKFLAEKNIVILGSDNEPVRITKGLTISVTTNENPPDTLEVLDNTAGEPAEAMLDEDKEDEEGTEKRLARRQTVSQAKASSGLYSASQQPTARTSVLNSPDGLKRLGQRKAYSIKAAAGKSYFETPDEAEIMSSWFRQLTAKQLGIEYEGSGWDKQVCTKASFTIQNTPGGALVPSIFEPTLVKNREAYGLAESLIGTTQMASMSEVRPVWTDWATVSAGTENAAADESSLAYTNVELNAKEWRIFAAIPTSLALTAAIDIEAEIFDNFQYAFAKKLDDVVFNGDGTAASFGIAGFRAKLLAVDSVIANIAGLQVGSGNLYSEAALADFMGAAGRTPEYADVFGTEWVIHKKTYLETAARVAAVSGGTSAEEIINFGGQLIKTFLASKVNYLQNMPRVQANSQVYALHGAFPLAAKIGLVANSLSLEADRSWGFRNNQIAYRMNQLVAVNVHDVGNTTEAGPVVGVITAAS